MPKISAAVVVMSLCVAVIHGAERQWQTGVWRDVQVKRPKIVFGMSPNMPNNGAPRTTPGAAQEIRTYVIETDTQRLELKETTVADAPRIDALVGEPVTFAIEKKTIYIKDADGREHRFALTRQTKR